MNGRRIIHLDMDAFFASVAQRDDPALRGRPVVVGGPPQSRGVVCAASYEARRFGIRSAMPCAQAHRLCREALFVPPDFARYKEVSRQVQDILRSATELIEPLSLDEAFLEVTVNKLHLRTATAVAEHLRWRIREELCLTASAGVAGNKLVAKIASDANKPDGICVVPPPRAAAFLAGLPVRRLPGIGPRTEERCHQAGLRLLAELREAPEAVLTALFGQHAEQMRQRAWGIDERPVVVSRQRKSLGIEDTFASDLPTLAEAVAQLALLAAELERRVQRSGLVGGRTVTLKVKYDDFEQVTRSRSLADPLGDAAGLMPILRNLLADTAVGTRPVRLLGIALSQLDDGSIRQERLELD